MLISEKLVAAFLHAAKNMSDTSMKKLIIIAALGEHSRDLAHPILLTKLASFPNLRNYIFNININGQCNYLLKRKHFIKFS